MLMTDDVACLVKVQAIAQSESEHNEAARVQAGKIQEECKQFWDPDSLACDVSITCTLVHCGLVCFSPSVCIRVLMAS